MKTIFITGSTDGIGKLAAIQLAKDGHQIYIHGRNNEKLNQVVAEIKQLTNNQNIKGLVADFSDLSAIQSMAKDMNEDLTKIDVLINNAGVFKSENPTNKDGHDLRYVVNYFAPFVLTRDLLPLLQKGTNPRLINLSSAAQSPIDYDVIEGKKQAPQQATYAQSKLALTMWSFHLSKTLQNIAVIAVNPGSLLNTNMVREAYGHSWSSADKGAQILYDLAVGDEHEGINGKYFDNDKGSYGQAHDDAYDEEKINILIKKSKELLG